MLSLLLYQSASAQVTLKGLDEYPELAAYLQKTVLDLYKTTEEEPLTPISLVKAKIKKALEAKGYYDHKLVYHVTPSNSFDVIPGNVFRVASVAIKGLTGTLPLAIQAGDTLTAEAVLSAQNNLIDEIYDTHCFYKLSINHEVVLNKQNNTAAVIFIIKGDKEAQFGPSIFTGADSIKRSYLASFLAYDEGACWDPRKIEKTRAALLDTGLLISINTNLPQVLPQDKMVAINYELKERAPRTVRLGARFSTAEGPGVIAEWRHLNYLGEDEDLSVVTQVSSLEQSLALNFSKPRFFSNRQSLNLSSELERQDTDAFEAVGFSVQSSISREINTHWMGSLGLEFEASTVTDQDGLEETFALISAPARFSFDNRDNLLDPHKGYRFLFGFEPFFDVAGESDPFLKSRVTGSTYFNLSRGKYDPVLAIRGSIGTILGSDTNSIPASERFFAGGGGSVRGFGFQEAGPQDESRDPLGGRSLIETSIELRTKLSSSLGGVVFIDGGAVYDDIVPDFSEPIFFGAGIGARYFTDFGPIRLDIALPLNEKEQADQSVQLYISIGQAF